MRLWHWVLICKSCGKTLAKTKKKAYPGEVSSTGQLKKLENIGKDCTCGNNIGVFKRITDKYWKELK